jgi:Putative beta-barrel porin 2
MGTRKKGIWLAGMAASLLMSALPSAVWADWVDVLSKFKPRITLLEEYTSNVFLTSTNAKEDFITTISPGITFKATENAQAKMGLDLSYDLGLVYYARNSEKDYVSHTGALNTWYSWGQRWTLRLWDSYTRSQEPVEGVVAIQTSPGVFYPGSQSGRFTYERNTLTPSLTYQFGPEDLFQLTYTNDYYNTENPVGDDSLGNTVSPLLTYWFNVHNGITLQYTFITVDYQSAPDLNSGHRGRARYTYRFDPATSVFADYIYDTLDYDSPGINYSVNNPSAGITHAFTPSLNGRFQAGYFWRNPESGKTITGPTIDAGITQRSPRVTLDLTVQGGYAYDFFGAEGLGFTKYYRGIAAVVYHFTQRFFSSLTATLERDEFPDEGDRKDLFGRAAAELSYMPWRWFTVSLGGSYGQRDSNVDINDYEEWRAFLRLTASTW